MLKVFGQVQSWTCSSRINEVTEPYVHSQYLLSIVTTLWLFAIIEHSCHHTQLCGRMWWEVLHLLSLSSLCGHLQQEGGTHSCQPVDHSCARLSTLSRLAAITSVSGPHRAQIPAFYQIPQPNHVVSSAFGPPASSPTGELPSRPSENSIEHSSIFCPIGGKVICSRRGLLV